MTIEKFEDIVCWQNAKFFAKLIYMFTGQKDMVKDFAFKDQIRKAAISIMNNIAEGFERNNNREFIRFLNYSKGSAGEVRSMLYLAKELNYISSDQFTTAYRDSLVLIKQISKFIKYLQDSEKNKIMS
jgi:four helix bundle protein